MNVCLGRCWKIVHFSLGFVSVEVCLSYGGEGDTRVHALAIARSEHGGTKKWEMKCVRSVSSLTASEWSQSVIIPSKVEGSL